MRTAPQGTSRNPLTSHARARMQQRGIGPDALDLLLSYGREAYDHHGAVILYMALQEIEWVNLKDFRARAACM